MSKGDIDVVRGTRERKETSTYVLYPQRPPQTSRHPPPPLGGFSWDHKRDTDFSETRDVDPEVVMSESSGESKFKNKMTYDHPVELVP